MPRTARAALPAAVVALLTGALTSACVPNDSAGAAATSGASGGVLTVSSTADACDLSSTTAPSGTLRFTVTNDGSDVTEFYLLAEDGLRVVGEVENVGPGLSREMVVQAEPGTYVASCKPGMVGDGIRTDLTVTDSGVDVGPTGDTAERLAAAEESYRAYVKDQAGALLTATQSFADAYVAGDDDAARAQYAAARVHWERIEPVAESFGDLDPLLDLREADLEEGAAWTGWHLLEKDLWAPAPEANGGVAYTPLAPDARTAAAADLVANTEELLTRVNDEGFGFEAFQIANGAKELLDEVATGKVTGEEEIWSHTDLWDFAANLDGARVAYEVLADVVEEEDPDLAATLDERFAALGDLLAQQGSVATGFTSYDALTEEQVRELAAGVDALSEPLSRLTSVVTSA